MVDPDDSAPKFRALLEGFRGNLADLAGAEQMLRGLGTLDVEMVRPAKDELGSLKHKLIVLLKDGRWGVVCAGSPETGEICLYDSVEDPRWLPVEEFMGKWDGTGLQIRPKSPHPSPRMWLPGGDIDMGSLSGPQKVRSVTLLNTGSAPLRIKSAKFNCGCASAKIRPSLLSPGGHATMKVTVRPGERPFGDLTLKLLISTNEPEASRHLVQVRGQHVRATGFGQGVVSAGEIRPDQATADVTAHFTVGDGSKIDLQPHYLDPGLRWISAKRVSDYDYRVTLRLHLLETYRDPSGSFRCAAYARLGTGPGRTYRLLVTGHVSRWIECTPGQIFAGTLKPGEVTSHSVRFKSLGEAPVDVRFDPELIDAKVEAKTVLVKVSAPQKPGLFRRSLVLRTRDHYAAVPIVGVVRTAPQGSSPDDSDESEAETDSAPDADADEMLP
jgi:hypothetical protein